MTCVTDAFPPPLRGYLRSAVRRAAAAPAQQVTRRFLMTPAPRSSVPAVDRVRLRVRVALLELLLASVAMRNARS